MGCTQGRRDAQHIPFSSTGAEGDGGASEASSPSTDDLAPRVLTISNDFKMKGLRSLTSKSRNEGLGVGRERRAFLGGWKKEV